MGKYPPRPSSLSVTDSKVQKQDPGDTQGFCIVAFEERSGKAIYKARHAKAGAKVPEARDPRH